MSSSKSAAAATDEDRVRTHLAGFDAHLTQPVHRAQLMKRMTRLRLRESNGPGGGPPASLSL